MGSGGMRAFFYKFIKDHYMLNRTAVSEDTDKLVYDIQKDLKCKILEIPSGTECLTWVIPKFWKVNEAYLSQLDGTPLIDFADNPLHLWTNSVSFNGKIGRDELESHLYYA